MRLYWASPAEQDRTDILEYIARDNLLAAVQLDERFKEAAARLAEYPMMGHPGHIAGTREVIPHESYRLIYEVDSEEVRILALVHTSRMWPPISAR